MDAKYNYFLDRSRVIAFLDVDCFSAQVAVRLFPKLKGKPCAIRRTPSATIDSVSYEAKNVFKGMTAFEAKDKCPGIQILSRSKILGFKEKEQKMSNDLFEVIQKFCKTDVTIEKMSVDDLFLDLSDKCNAFIDEQFSYDQKFLQSLEVVIEGGVRQFSLAKNKSFHRSKWAEAAVIMTDLCDHIYDKTGLICSVGISFNKLLAKIGCKLNKPDTITIIASKVGINRVFENYPIWMCDGLGYKFGAHVQSRLKVSTLADLRKFRRKVLTQTFGPSNGSFLWETCRGIDYTPVQHKIDFSTIGFKHKYPKGIDCEDKRLFDDLYIICEQMANKMNKDLERNQRIAHRIRIEVFTKSGRTLSATTYLMSKTYNSKQIYDIVVAKRFPHISKEVPKSIKAFRITAIDFKVTQKADAISDLTEQMSGITV